MVLPAVDQPRQYSLPGCSDVQSFLEILGPVLKFSRGAPRRVQCQLLDTFDWRLHRAGLLLIAYGGEDGWELELLTPGGQREAMVRVPTLPRLAVELADGALASRMSAICDCRALLTRLATQVHRQPLAVLDQYAKTVVRLELETHESKDLPRALPLGLRVEPVRGFREALASTWRSLAVHRPVPAPAMPIMEGLQQLGVEPGDYDPRPRRELAPGTPAGEALRAVLRDLLATMRTNESGVREDLDPEFLHDYRVAVRRTRAALGQLKQVLPAAEVSRFRAEFAWLGQTTGPTRDLDVNLLHFDQLAATLPEPLRPHLEPLRARLREDQRREQQKLVTLLDDQRYHRLLGDWEALLTAAEHPEAPRAAALSIDEIAHQRIWKAYRRVLREAKSLDEDSPDDDFHELRKSCKKLRYLMELFQSLFPTGKIKSLIKVLKGLQENLGDHQDQAVQAAALRERAATLQADPDNLDLLLAMGALVGDLVRRQQRSRDDFAARFRAFNRSEHRQAFRALFCPTTSGKQHP